MTTTSTNYLHYFKHYTYPLLPGDLLTDNIIHIEHVSLRDPSSIFGHNFRIDQEDTQSLAIRELSVDDINFAHGVRIGEHVVNGEEVIVRHKCAGLVCLDLRVFYALKANPALTAKLFTSQSIDRMYFDGSILVNAYGRRFVPALFHQDGAVRSVLSALDYGRGVNDRSAVLIV